MAMDEIPTRAWLAGPIAHLVPSVTLPEDTRTALAGNLRHAFGSCSEAQFSTAQRQMCCLRSLMTSVWEPRGADACPARKATTDKSKGKITTQSQPDEGNAGLTPRGQICIQKYRISRQYMSLNFGMEICFNVLSSPPSLAANMGAQTSLLLRIHFCATVLFSFRKCLNIQVRILIEK